jgi:hypothetical protein
MRRIAENPCKSLAELEKELGVAPGDLQREMSDLAEEAGDWSVHVPFTVAESYFQDQGIRAQFQEHVDSCNYCKRLIDTLQPADPVEASQFGRAAAQTYREERRRRARFAVAVTGTATVSIVLTLVVLQFLPDRMVSAFIRSDGQRDLVHALTRDSSLLDKLESGRTPAERFRAANVYFTMDQPQTAYREIGAGLKMAGIRGNDAEKITTAADVPADRPAAAIASAARKLQSLKSDPNELEPADWLSVAEGQAKLGLNKEALESIRRYLEATKTDPKLVAEFSENAQSGPNGASE